MHDFDRLLDAITGGATALAVRFVTAWVLIQGGLILLAIVAAWGLAAYQRRRIDLISMTQGWPAILHQALRAALANLGLVNFVLIVFVMRFVVQSAVGPGQARLLGIAASLATAWVVISVLASVIHNRLVNRVVKWVVWTLVALGITGLLDEAVATLDAFGIVIGGMRVTPLLAIKTAALLVLTLWGAILLANFFDMRLRTYSDLTPSIQVLLAKLIRIALITFAVLIVLGSVGIDFSALAIFSGAVGVGVGFGLQKIVSNLVSGIILLADKSVKPGDVISVGEHFGWIGTMGARYTSVASRDGREYLIPNEDFITQRVTNWSYSTDLVRLEIKFGVTYASDPHVVRKVAVDSAATVDRVLADPEPSCHLRNFGDSAIEFVLRFWIRDPRDGLGGVRNAVMLAVWDSFKREGIEFPFPQREVSLNKPVRVLVEREAP